MTHSGLFLDTECTLQGRMVMRTVEILRALVNDCLTRCDHLVDYQNQGDPEPRQDEHQGV